MKKILALVLVLCLFGALAACTEVTRITVNDPAKITLEKAGGGMAVTLTDEKTVDRITDVVCQIPLQATDSISGSWDYRIIWLDDNGDCITEITITGSQIRWEGKSYNLGVGVDLSVLNEMLETIPTSK